VRVLLIGEGATLAHAARPLALAAGLPKDRCQVFLAIPARYQHWAPRGVQVLPLDAQSPEVFAERLRRGLPLFSRSRLEAYFDEDLRLIEQTQCQAVVGDFRLSLAASARKARVPYVSISNAYWSPDRPLHPVRPVLERFAGWPAPLAELAFRLVAAPAIRWHAEPLDMLLANHGLEPLGRDIRRTFTEADATLYADLPALFPDVPETPRRHFLGPLIWEPPTPPPPWWDLLPNNRPLAYLTLGSSGAAQQLGAITGWLRGMGYAVILATAGQAELHGDDETVFVADFVPGYAACERADLVVCNGGSPTATQALLRGRPVLGICSNMDQMLNMRAVQELQAGVGLRADALGRPNFEAAVNRLSGFKAMKAAANLATGVKTADPGEVLLNTIEGLLKA
jgi:UDP:flavonoid glycosyltransferase YjiC (YdhE family)